jgi:hypothetical protein
MNANTRFILLWSDRMMKRLGCCGVVTCEAIFHAEGGHETPDGDATPEAVGIAKAWEMNPDLMWDYVRASGRWCMAPSWGCLHGLGEPCLWVQKIHESHGTCCRATNNGDGQLAD